MSSRDDCKGVIDRINRSGDGRVVFDISTSMRWSGAPVGIVRVERKLGLWAYSNIPGVVFAFFDPTRLVYCEVTHDARAFLSGEAALDTFGLTNPAVPGRRRSDRIPAAIKTVFFWISQTRRMALNQLERLRLGTRHLWVARWADRLQRPLLSDKYRAIMVRDDGTRQPFFPYDMVVGAPITFERNDILVCAGSGWGNSNIDALSQLKSQIGFRMSLLCYDLIPLLFPQFYYEHDVKLFTTYMHKALALADCILVNSRKVETDCRDYCARHHITAGDIAVVPLGYDVETECSKLATHLPAGLLAGQFAMFVSTIEPRKGHRLLYNVWRRLVAEGVPQVFGFKLVFVGRPGWLVDDLLAEIRNDAEVAKHLVMIHGVDDGALTALYQAAAFCVYPSVYEGYGLPIIEAFSFGKAALVSTGGALPEVVQGLSPCLDPADEQAWYEAMKKWIEAPQCRAPYEQEIRTRLRHPTWSETAAIFFANALSRKSK